MGERMQLPLEEIKLAFAASCVEGAARKLGVPYIEVYERMNLLVPSTSFTEARLASSCTTSGRDCT